MVAEVNGHDAVGDVSVRAKQIWLKTRIKYTKKLTHKATITQMYLFGSVPLRNR